MQRTIDYVIANLDWYIYIRTSLPSDNGAFQSEGRKFSKGPGYLLSETVIYIIQIIYLYILYTVII